MHKVFKPVPLERKHPRKDFDCSDVILNSWLAQYSVQAQKKRSSKSYVSLDENGKIAGFYSLVFGQVEREVAPEEITKGMPKHPIPVLIVARLAVDVNYQGIGLGKTLMQDAMIRALSASDIGGLRAVAVHAKHEEAANFYKHLGFLPTSKDPLLLVVPIKKLAETLR